VDTAKKAYLSTLLNPPPQLTSTTSFKSTIIKPYDGPDAQSIIQNVNARNGNGRGHGSRQSIANGTGFPGGPHVRQPSIAEGGHKRAQSLAAGMGGSLGRNTGLNIAAANSLANGGREPSPTLPSLPSHPTLNALISSTLSDLSPSGEAGEVGNSYMNATVPPKVGDPARRMVGAALGIRHPGVAPKTVDGGLKDVTKSMGGLAVTAE